MKNIQYYRYDQSRDDEKSIRSKQASHLRYEGEDSQVYVLSDSKQRPLIIPKNRTAPETILDLQAQSLDPAFRLLVAAFFGLSLAGLGTLVLAPLAMAWALAVYFTRPLLRANRVRVIIILGISAGLISLALLLIKLFLTHSI